MNGRRLVDRVYADVVRIIEQNDLKTGDRLPAEARLADMLAVSRTVVREALVRLGSDGIVEARRGAGSFVKRRPSGRLSDHMPMSELSATLGTYEVRFVLEAEAARLAATRRSEADMDAISAAMDALRNALLSNSPAHEEDMALHQAIMRGTGNQAFVAAFERMHEEVDRVMQAGVDISRSRSAQAIQAMIDEHETVVEAIRHHDADGAALAMRWHLSQGRKRLMP
ncbi:GntR family transcriptional regulator [Sphingomonas oleivorans]|uniref:GntR family transcriptional regulator n=1 Tax=Sphingomonas oleivorans TaxID=1735121 RepID=A0A2T5FU62_9SPHN|nr:FCD domain-containing protein [Sphingomonas oleivorans]PTQ07828.1 GntR family transcriptional regulator [Sphingomonas oleivorans]